MDGIFYDIFGDIVFHKIKQVDMYYMYVAVLQSFLAKGKECVILLVPFNKSTLEKANIFQLEWSCLQTRLLDNTFGLSEQALDSKKLDTRYVGKIPLRLLSRDEKKTTYTPTFSYTSEFDLFFHKFEISILHDPKKKSIYQYPDDIDLRHALKTFNCIVKKS